MSTTLRMNNTTTAPATHIRHITKESGHAQCHMYHEKQIYFGLPETFIWATISVLTIAVNSRSIKRIIHDTGRLSNHHIYLSSLLASNVVVGIVVHPGLAYTAYGKITPCSWNIAIALVSMFSIYVSLLSALGIALNRLCAMNISSTRVFNTVQRRRTKKKHIVVAVAIWIVSLVRCASMLLLQGNPFPPILIPVAVLAIGIVYSLLTKKLNHFARRTRLTNTRSTAPAIRRYEDGTRFVRLILVLFGTIWVPFVIYHIVGLSIGKRNVVMGTILNKAFWLVPLLDPFCYLFFQKSERTVVRRASVAAVHNSIAISARITQASPQ